MAVSAGLFVMPNICVWMAVGGGGDGHGNCKLLYGKTVQMNTDEILALATGPLIAFIAVAAIIPAAAKLSLRFRFVDRPGGRKAHSGAVPPIGGLVLFPVFMMACALTGADMQQLWPLFVSLSLILITGALDDYRQLNAWVKFFMHFLCASMIVLAGDEQIYQLGNLFGMGDFGLGFMSVPFSIISVVLFINAINLMDGIDGLAGGQGFIVLFWLAAACVTGNDYITLTSVLPLMGALAGFLFHNMRSPLRARASVFLGDAGSMGLGLVLGWFCITLAQGPQAPLTPISVAWILALPIIDTCGQFYRRVKEGRHPFSPDRGHFHHHFIHAGLSVGKSTALILLIAFLFGGIGYFGARLGVPEWVLALTWTAMLLAHIGLSRMPGKYIGFISRVTGARPKSL